MPRLYQKIWLWHHPTGWESRFRATFLRIDAELQQIHQPGSKNNALSSKPPSGGTRQPPWPLWGSATGRRGRTRISISRAGAGTAPRQGGSGGLGRFHAALGGAGGTPRTRDARRGPDAEARARGRRSRRPPRALSLRRQPLSIIASSHAISPARVADRHGVRALRDDVTED